MDSEILMELNMLGNSTNSTSAAKCSLSTQMAPFWTFTAYAVANVVILLPLLGFVVFVSARRCLDSSASTSSHADVFTYNAVAMETIQVLACTSFCISVFLDVTWMIVFSQSVIYITLNVKPEFLMLTCVELYLAVVFPITYLRHKASAGVTVRNISICCVWLTCILWAVFTFKYIFPIDTTILYFLHMAVVLFVICFCCVSVLWTLKQRGPGDATRDGEQADRSKLRAFYTILVIMTVLFLSVGGGLVCDAIDNSLAQKKNPECFSAPCAEWMSLPSSFVLPLLFLQRAGKLQCCKRQNQSNK